MGGGADAELLAARLMPRDAFLWSLPSVTMETWKHVLLPNYSFLPFCIFHKKP